MRFAVHEEHRSVREIAEGVVAQFGGRANFVPWPEDRKRMEVDNVRIDGAAFRAETGWRPRFSFVDGLRQLKGVIAT